jgi:hypothetical protein
VRGRLPVKVSRDALIAALLHPSLYLVGDSTGCISLYCHDHVSRYPIAYYGRDEDDGGHRQPEVAYAPTIPSLWAAAADHLTAAHRSKPDGAVDDA